MTITDWARRWPQYRHTVPDEVLYEPVERRLHQLLRIAQAAACRCGVSYEHTLTSIHRGLCDATFPEMRDDDLEQVKAELDRLRTQKAVIELRRSW